MIKIDQNVFGADKGNCMQAAMASLLELPLEEVPHFISFGNEWFTKYLEFINKLDLMYIGTYSSINMHDMLAALNNMEGHNGLHLATVPSKTYIDLDNPVYHSVIIDKTGLVVHDPNPNKLWQDINVIETQELSEIIELKEKPAKSPFRPMRIVVTGYGRHGKDTVCNVIQKEFDMKWVASSAMACRLFIFLNMAKDYGYKNMEECFEDRHNHRQYWFEAIRHYNKDDRGRLGKEIFKSHQVYCGIRCVEEFNKLKADGEFDYAIWVDASKRLKSTEGTASMTVSEADCDFTLDNNGTARALHTNIVSLINEIKESENVSY